MNTDNFDLIIIGAGLAGATVAHIAAYDYHQKVLVIEKQAHVAGVLFDEKDPETGLMILKYGMHYLHTGNTHVYKFLSSIVDWDPFILTARAELDGKLVASPFNFSSIDQLYSAEDAAELKARLTKHFDYVTHASLMDMIRCDDEIIREFAKKLMRKYVIPYTAKQRGVPESELNGIVLAGYYMALSYTDQCRMDRYQMLPREGFTSLINKMLSDERITVKLNANYKEYIQITDKGELKFRQGNKKIPVIYTGGLDELFTYRYGKLPYYTTEFKIKTEVAGSKLAPYTTYTQKEYISAVDCAMLSSGYHGETTKVVYEYSRGMDDSENTVLNFPPPSKRAWKQYAKYKALADRINGLYLCGRLPRYRFMDMAETVLDAFAVINSIKFGEIDMIPDGLKYKRPPEMLLAPLNNFERNDHVKSDLLIGDLSRDLPEISVIIPTYKRLDGLKRVLKAVYAQDLPRRMYDIVVVDNDPEVGNETQRYFEENAPENLYYYKNRENLGLYGNLNRCLLLSRTKWACMVHDDDIIFPNAIRWALNSRDAINDPKLAVIIPRQLRAYSEMEVQSRMKERGVVYEQAVAERKKYIPKQKCRWMYYWKLFEDTRRRFWRVSKFDCYMIPYLYPAISYGTLINCEAMIDVGGFYEGYPMDDNFTMNRLSEKYHVYLCGENWGIYSYHTAVLNKPRVTFHFVDGVAHFRRYIEKRNLLCRALSGLVRKGFYIVEAQDDIAYGLYQRGYAAKIENYNFYDECLVGEDIKKWAKRIQKCWEFWVMLRTKLFGKRISFDLVRRCNGEHF